MTDRSSDFQLTIPALMHRAERLTRRAEIVSRLPDRSIHRYCYGDMIRRARQLAVALRALGVRPGDRVATLAWNHHRHLEAYFAVASIGAVLHTLNLRLHPSDLSYIVDHAQDRVVIVDASLLSVLAGFQDARSIRHLVVIGDAQETPKGAIDYEALVASADPDAFEYPDLDERDAASLCYTSGTTGRPKGVSYSHRSIALQAMNWTATDTVGVGRRDTLMIVVPMFHINGWCLPFTAALVGARLVLPGAFVDPESLLELIVNERVTLSAGVPTVWLGVLQALDGRPAPQDIALRTLVIGGSAVPKTLIRQFHERYGVTVLQAWGMTETTALATVSAVPPGLEDAPIDEQYEWRAKQGVPMPFVEVRARGEEGLVAWDGNTMGELEVRGPAVATSYYGALDAADSFTDDHWLRTGDVGTIDANGCVELRDRSKDLIRSGGEWISSVALENTLMEHPAVADAAVIAVPHAKWGERPIGVVVLKPGRSAAAVELQAYLAPTFAKWWLPDRFEFVEQIPRTSTGKILKAALRERFYISTLECW